ncbi:uncharacterized protein KRP23_7937 [Phytophthora ramorum]|uniref:uncharacterized protein n=1 Tax=Phytophthora ramorum TaxID=164328 RepID=UPI00309A0DFE|nr:hypothetical protein KRP23_7937 [Phytophthora ramorum]
MHPSRDEPWAAPALDVRRSADVRRFLSESDEQEVLAVLREQFRHERRITSDDVRFVVRAVASHGGAVGVPPDFPPTRWILEFKRANGFAQLGGFAFGLPERLNVGSRSSSVARVTASSGGSSSDEEIERHGGRYAPVGEPNSFARYSTRPNYDSDSPLQRSRRQQHQQQHQRRSMVVDERRAGALWQQREQSGDREELGSNTSSASVDSENGTTTGASSSSSSVSASADLVPLSSHDNSRSNSNYDSQDSASTSASKEKRSYKLSHTVPPETWEKAIAAVEQQGMSLRAAAKMYGVHFAALHRRVKKRAQGGQSTKGNNGYFHPSDEAGIMRVVVARAELGVLMTFDELMTLVETAALRKLPDISVENARKLMVRFETRNEQSIRHIIVDWPPPLPITSSSTGASHYHLEHPGYEYGSESSSLAGMQRSFAARAVGNTDGTATAAAVAAAPSQFAPPSRVGPFLPNNNNRPIVLPSMNLNRSALQPPDTAVPCHHRLAQAL